MIDIFKGVKAFRIKKVYSKGKALYYPQVLIEEKFMKFFSFNQWKRIGIHGTASFGLYFEDNFPGLKTLEEAEKVISDFKKEVAYIDIE